jgi:hypothetical protein
MLSWIYPDASTEKGRAEVCERIRAVAHNYPAVLEEMRPSARQLRNAVKKYGLVRRPGQSLSELPVLSAKGPLVNAAIENFARKLFCALYYKHTGQILPSSGGIAVRWYSNVQIERDQIPRSIAQHWPGFLNYSALAPISTTNSSIAGGLPIRRQLRRFWHSFENRSR